MSERREHEFAGLAFVACMFIGAGIGLAFDRPDVGGCIGDNNVGYNTKMEGYTTSMSDMNELSEIPNHALRGEKYE